MYSQYDSGCNVLLCGERRRTAAGVASECKTGRSYVQIVDSIERLMRESLSDKTFNA